MESMLASMNDETLMGEIIIATKIETSYDSLPVFEPWHFSEFENSISPKYKEPINLPDDNIHTKIYKLLDSIKFRKDSSLEIATQAINLIEKFKVFGFDNVCRGLVYFPDILRRYISAHRSNISDDDL